MDLKYSTNNIIINNMNNNIFPNECNNKYVCGSDDNMFLNKKKRSCFFMLNEKEKCTLKRKVTTTTSGNNKSYINNRDNKKIKKTVGTTNMYDDTNGDGNISNISSMVHKDENMVNGYTNNKSSYISKNIQENDMFNEEYNQQINQVGNYDNIANNNITSSQHIQGMYDNNIYVKGVGYMNNTKDVKCGGMSTYMNDNENGVMNMEMSILYNDRIVNNNNKKNKNKKNNNNNNNGGIDRSK